MKKEILLLRKELKTLNSAEGKAAAQRFHKETIRCYGIRTPVVRALAKREFLAIKPLGKEAIFGFCEDLFASGFVEEAQIACEWSFALKRSYDMSDLDVFEGWISGYVNNWAICDGFCNNTVGHLLLRFPACLPRLKKWAVADNRWLQRAAAVSLIIPARKGEFSAESFAIADMLLRSPDDLVQKGYGWLLKVVSKPHPKEVFQFVADRKHVMPRTALRYAIEHFSPTQKKQLMAEPARR